MLQERRDKLQRNNQGFKRAVSVQRQKKAAAIKRQDEAQLRKWARAVTPDITPYPPSYPKPHQHYDHDPYGSDPMAPIQMDRVKEHERMLSDALSAVRGHWGTEAATSAQPSVPHTAPQSPHHQLHQHQHQYHQHDPAVTDPAARYTNEAIPHPTTSHRPMDSAAQYTNHPPTPPANLPAHHRDPAEPNSSDDELDMPTTHHRTADSLGDRSFNNQASASSTEQTSYRQDSLRESSNESGNESADSLDSLADHSILEPDLEPMYEGQLIDSTSETEELSAATAPEPTMPSPTPQSRQAWGRRSVGRAATSHQAPRSLMQSAHHARPTTQHTRPPTTQHTRPPTTHHTLRTRPGTQQLVVARRSPSPTHLGHSAEEDFKVRGATHADERSNIWDGWSRNQMELKARQTPTDEDINYLWQAVQRGLDGHRHGTADSSSSSRVSSRPPSRRSVLATGGVVSARPPSSASSRGGRSSRSSRGSGAKPDDAAATETAAPKSGLPRPTRVRTERSLSRGRSARPPTVPKTAVPVHVAAGVGKLALRHPSEQDNYAIGRGGGVLPVPSFRSFFRAPAAMMEHTQS